MPPLKSILVMTDRSADAQVALQKAVVIARHFDAKLELLACDPEHPWAARGPGHAAAGARAVATRSLDSRRFLEALRGTISADDLQIHTSDDFDGPLHEGLARKVCSGGHSLVVNRLLRREGRRRSALTPTDWQVIRSCPVPMMLTRGRPWRPLPRFVATLGRATAAAESAPDEVLDVARYLADGCRGALEIIRNDSNPGGARPDAALASMPAPREIDVVVLRPFGREPASARDDAGATLAERIVDTLDCDVLLLPHAPLGR